jgi:predicted negative regulator of RcsB-dependent stress response
MANPLDLQEQEQLEDLKAFWRRYGNLITWTLTLALGGFAAWNGWNWYQREQGFKAGAIYDELERSVQAGELERSARIFSDLKERHPGTVWAAQGALLLAREQGVRGKADDAVATLDWAAQQAGDEALKAVASLRLAAAHLDAGRHDKALQVLDTVKAPDFQALVADRRGDVLMAMGRSDDAVKAYQSAWAAMPETLEYRSLVQAKLTSLGAPPKGTEAAGVSR